jgi:hypothetical protein
MFNFASAIIAVAMEGKEKLKGFNKIVSQRDSGFPRLTKVVCIPY